MSLSAVVYRSKKHLQLGNDEGVAQFIPERGEVYFENDELSRKYRQQLQAAHTRLGNITEIAGLRDEIARLSVPSNILRDKILYSGSHSGDFIPLDELSLLLDEIRIVRRTGKASKEMRSFLDRIEELVRTATNETNPIVFV